MRVLFLEIFRSVNRGHLVFGSVRLINHLGM